jgi:uncharacterized protein (DUF302 family)
MMNKLLVVIVLVVLAAPVWANTGVVTVPSSMGFSQTLDRFKAALNEKGIKVAFELDHQANGKRVEESLGKTHLLLFGSPKLGTPLMRSVRSIGIDLPMKVLIWEDDDGKAFLTYNDPQYLAVRHGIEDNKAIVKKMSAVLKMLTTTAAQKP